MANKLRGINGKVLTWARVRAGLSVAEVAASFNKTETVIRSWEAEEDMPTYAQLEKLSYTLYKRPLAMFFLSEPPEDKDPKPDFRLLPGYEKEQLKPDTRYAVRLMQARQESIREFARNRTIPPNPFINTLNLKADSHLEQLCKQVRTLLKVDLETQFAWRDTRQAMKQWREAVESLGIYVFKRSFKEKGINGFCLVDSLCPLICINNSTAQTRQIFTLFHELAHLLASMNGFTKDDTGYINALPPSEQQVEVMCNRFAAEFLVPRQAFNPLLKKHDTSDESIAALADQFCVSREVILRRFLEEGLVSQADYERRSRQWNQAWLERTKGSGGNFFATQAAYLSPNFIKLGFSDYYSGKSSKEELAGHFGLKVRHLDSLENHVLGA